MAIILGNWYSRIKGGWKTVGAGGVGAFAAGTGPWVPTTVGPMDALKLSAFFACVRLKAEVAGSFTFQLLDNANKVVMDHDLYGLMRSTPNSYQTGDQFTSGMAANMNVFGNSMAHIRRYTPGGAAYALDFYTTDLWRVESDAQGRPKFWLDDEPIPYDDVLHWCGFGMSGYWGLPSLLMGGEVMAMQRESNNAAAQTFANGLRAGGFFKLPENKQAFSNEQLGKFNTELQKMGEPGNTSKWLTLLPGIEPVTNTAYRIDPVTAELLQSRYFGIEEICRFQGVPPPLIGHTDKASSWASSVENLNQFLHDYTLLPPTIRYENQIARKLLGRNERNRLRPKYNMDSLLRGNIKTRYDIYKIGREIGMLNADDARNRENMPAIPDGKGQDYTPLKGKNGKVGESDDTSDQS